MLPRNAREPSQASPDGTTLDNATTVAVTYVDGTLFLSLSLDTCHLLPPLPLEFIQSIVDRLDHSIDVTPPTRSPTTTNTTTTTAHPTMSHTTEKAQVQLAESTAAVPQTTVAQQSDNVAHALAGAGGGLLSMALTYPLITLSTRAQVESKRAQLSTLDAARRIIKREGIAGLYAGLDSALFGISVTNFVYYYCTATLHIHSPCYPLRPSR